MQTETDRQRETDRDRQRETDRDRQTETERERERERIRQLGIKMGSDDSHFNISLIVRETKSQDSVHRPHILKRKERRREFEPRSLCLPA